MTRPRFNMLSVVLLVSGLNACAVSDNPREGGLLGGLYGIMGGGYDKRVEDRQRNLDALKNLEQSKRSEQQTLQQDKNAQQTELQKLTRKSQHLAREVGKLSQQIEQKQVQTSEALAKKQALAKRTENLQGDVKVLQGRLQDSSSAEIQQYQAEEKRLNDEIHALKTELYQLK